MPTSRIPTWFRYYAFRNVLDLGDYDKDKEEFTNVPKEAPAFSPTSTAARLAYVEQMMESRERPRHARASAPRPGIHRHAARSVSYERESRAVRQAFLRQAICRRDQSGRRDNARDERGDKGFLGQVPAGDGPTALWARSRTRALPGARKASPRRRPSSKAAISTSTTRLTGKEPTIPRIAIRMQGDAIGEVRGVADSSQNLEGNMAGIAEAKMNDLPGRNGIARHQPT